jgi:hypothetical protein
MEAGTLLYLFKEDTIQSRPSIAKTNMAYAPYMSWPKTTKTDPNKEASFCCGSGTVKG